MQPMAELATGGCPAMNQTTLGINPVEGLKTLIPEWTLAQPITLLTH